MKKSLTAICSVIILAVVTAACSTVPKSDATRRDSGEKTEANDSGHAGKKDPPPPEGQGGKDSSPEVDDTNIIEELEALVLFHTNIQRVANGKAPLVHEAALAKAARWQAAYCAGTGTLSHTSRVEGMRDFWQRIAHFGGHGGSMTGENLTIAFDRGTPGQIAYEMLSSWMRSPGHRANILGTFYRVGIGVSRGGYAGIPSYYGCQVFTAASLHPDAGKEAPRRLPAVKVSTTSHEGKPSYLIIFDGAADYDLKVLDVSRGDLVKEMNLDREEDGYLFVKREAPAGWLFITLLHRETGLLYPVAVLR